MPFRRSIAVAFMLGLTGCAAFRSYDAELNATLNYAFSGNVDGAIKTGSSPSNRLRRTRTCCTTSSSACCSGSATATEESQKTWMAASAQIQVRDPLTQVRSLVGTGSSYLVNDKLRTYEGYDYEKVMLLTYMALNHLAMGDYENARVAIKQTHELEALIAEQRAQQIAEVEEEAKKRGARASFKELNGYPVETIDNPEVNALQERLPERALALPRRLRLRGARRAEPGRAGLPPRERAAARPAGCSRTRLPASTARVAAPPDGMTDVLFIVASGTAPALQSRQFSLAVPVTPGRCLVPLSFPCRWR